MKAMKAILALESRMRAYEEHHRMTYSQMAFMVKHGLLSETESMVSWTFTKNRLDRIKHRLEEQLKATQRQKKKK